ncbi:MAG TPA: thiosulfate oxidation carrier complex protein SoxZ [Burkholderiales bacterium]|nr:thiosulfate oxidation carrier complex protein SoxZ [Burkholderiales bacterium]
MADPMRIRASARDGMVNVKVLMAHEMETGQRKDASGKVVPAHFIRNVSATHQGRTVLSAQWGPAVAKNPFLEFNFKGGQKGDKIAVSWEDNKGEKRTDEAAIN